ncbi:TetR/AcrR family transcriptional regulator [Rhodobacter sp. SY28-1]|uniref:TetR/AcrR family transcriptional regulator n=1 Tax=Rhodobacter sp. SY28-1 TaxID=2562317 RepID=UPI0010C013C0|nr:TetR/AcrR family transcriptional regulator [Rhodobacter sp. SY28-1]
MDKPRRTLARDQRRQQVIEATLTVIATRGLARLTLTDVAREAGISHGLVLFHFDSKENLLSDVLAYLADEYQRNWESAVLAAGPKAADQLLAMIEADFHPAVTTPARLAAWCAFWGEAQSRPAYQEICGARDAAQIARMEGLCAAVVKDGDYALDPIHCARILRLVIEGIWLDMMTSESPYSSEEGRRTVQTALSLCFPGHFAGPTDSGRQ